VLVTIAQQPGRAQITDIKRQNPSPPDARRPPPARRPLSGRPSPARRTHWIRLPCMDLAVMVDLTREPSR